MVMGEKLRHLFPASVPVRDWSVATIEGVPVITYWNPALGAQPTQAQLDTVTQADIDNAAALRLYSRAKALITADDEVSKKDKAVLLVILDEINLIRSKLSPVLPPRTITQLRNAVANKIDTGAANG